MLSTKKSSFLAAQQEMLRLKIEALTGKKLRQAGLLPRQSWGEAKLEEKKLSLWPLLFLVPLLAFFLWPKPKSTKRLPFNVSLPDVTFPAQLTLHYRENLWEEANACQILFKKLGIELELVPLLTPTEKANGLYLLEGAQVQTWGQHDLLAPIPQSTTGALSLKALIYPSLQAGLDAETFIALPLAVDVPYLFIRREPWRSAGLGERDLPQTWEDVLKVLPKFHGSEPVFWPFEESPLLWAQMLDPSFGDGALKTAAAWLQRLWPSSQAGTSKKAVLYVGREAPVELHWQKLPPTPKSSPAPLLAKVAYLACPKGETALAKKLPSLYRALTWQLPGGLLAPILGEAQGLALAALVRATPSSLDPYREQELIGKLGKLVTAKEGDRATD